MRPSLLRWISDADRLKHLETLDGAPASLEEEVVRLRVDDLYIALVGELFDLMRSEEVDAADYARVGNAFIDIAEDRHNTQRAFPTIATADARLFGAAAFYFGGFPASAFLSVRGFEPPADDTIGQACADLLGKRRLPRSGDVRRLLGALYNGTLDVIREIAADAAAASRTALAEGPSEWIPARLFEQLTKRFEATNLRAVLPDGGSARWTPLVESFVNRRAAAWEFFPSQIQAINSGLLTRNDTFSLQMPTGAGKTALCETLLYWNARSSETSAAVMLVPYRSLASELRATVVKRLNQMGVASGCVYGGTVPTGDEVHALDQMRVLIATPEALSGVLSADPTFLHRISLVICDEGHLLDGPSRGVSLELLLARLRTKSDPQPRCVFVSAIVPNIEEINVWLGGTGDSVIRSDYRASIAEFGVLRSTGSGANTVTALEMHPHELPPTRFRISTFLPASAFRFTNRFTGRSNSYAHTSYKTQAVASARKALSLGAVAVFATNKRGRQGAIGLAEELLNQLEAGINFPAPMTQASPDVVAAASDYLRREFGADWIGTRIVAVGAILHHGDIPQEVREALEEMLRLGQIKMAFCTNTLAEGVNLPIRTLVLYSVRRLGKEGRPEDLLTRDIKNLVGRAGRAGSTTKGLVICVNSDQWSLVERVARQSPGENVRGALYALILDLGRALARQSTTLTNEFLDGDPGLHSLVDGIDATLVDLVVEEMGEARLVAIAERIASETFAVRQGDQVVSDLLRQVFALRARQIARLQASGRIGWIRQTGARVRLIGPVETRLLAALPDWRTVEDATDSTFLNAMLGWVWMQPDIQRSIRDCFEVGNGPIAAFREPVFGLVRAWLAGASFFEMAQASKRTIDEVLRIHAAVVSYGMQTAIEQGIALLGKALESQGQALTEAVSQFPEHLRYGIPSRAGCVLFAAGVRHRRAAVLLGDAIQRMGVTPTDTAAIIAAARLSLEVERANWFIRLGEFVIGRTEEDLAVVNS